MYFDAEQKVRYCWVLLGHVEVENNTTYINYDYFKRTLWYKFMFYFVFYHLTRFGYLKIYESIFRCEEILKIMTLNTHRFSWKSAEKVVFHRFYQTCLIIFVGEIGGEIGEKIGRFLNRKIGGVTPHRFSCPTYRFLKKNRPTTTDFSIFVCLWKSVRKIVWWELGFTLPADLMSYPIS